MKVTINGKTDPHTFKIFTLIPAPPATTNAPLLQLLLLSVKFVMLSGPINTGVTACLLNCHLR